MKVGLSLRALFFILCGLLSVCLISLTFIQEFSYYKKRRSAATKKNAATSEEEFKYFKAKRVFSDEELEESRNVLNFTFNYLIEPNKSLALKRADHEGRGRSLLIFVNSKWSNFERRKRIRASWLNELNINKSLHNLHGQHMNTNLAPITRVEWLFALGLNAESDHHLRDVYEEAAEHKDLLLINLRESYRSLSWKHLAIFKWILARNRFSDEALVLKCDDDTLVNMESLLLSVPKLSSNLNTLSLEYRDWLKCAWFPGGMRTLRDANIKWALTKEEFPFDFQPAYCSGLAYLAPRKLLRRLYLAAQLLLWNESIKGYEEPLWIDDLFITGILRESLANKPLALNEIRSYCFTRRQYNYNPGGCTFSDLNFYEEKRIITNLKESHANLDGI